MPDENSLDRFVEAQTLAYPGALAEIRRGAKRAHWMWFVFPQIAGLGRSSAARHFAIRSADEARAFLDHPVLGPRYIESVSALQDLAVSDPVAVFGEVDAMKLRSSLTLFEVVRPSAMIGAALDRWFGGERDQRTLDLLGDMKFLAGRGPAVSISRCANIASVHFRSTMIGRNASLVISASARLTAGASVAWGRGSRIRITSVRIV